MDNKEIIKENAEKVVQLYFGGYSVRQAVDAIKKSKEITDQKN